MKYNHLGLRWMDVVTKNINKKNKKEKIIRVFLVIKFKTKKN